MLDSATLTPTATRPALPMRPRSADWLNVARAAALLEVDPSTLHRWRTHDQLEGVRTQKAGAYTYYWRPDVLKLRDRLAAGPAEEDPTDK